MEGVLRNDVHRSRHCEEVKGIIRWVQALPPTWQSPYGATFTELGIAAERMMLAIAFWFVAGVPRNDVPPGNRSPDSTVQQFDGPTIRRSNKSRLKFQAPLDEGITVCFS